MRLRHVPLFAAILLLGGCLGRVEVSQLVGPRPPAASAAPRPTLWYVGVGLYGETWSENDVAALADELAAEATGFRVAPAVFSNRAGRFPAANRDNVEAALRAAAQSAQPGDVAFLYVSTHGAPGLLGRSGAGPRAVTAGELREWLGPLGPMPTVVVLSACFSGSLIPPLAADNRVIFAAARADRTSFGCRAGAEHTVFGRALLDALATPGVSLRDAVARTVAAVAAAERAQGIRAPSEPQVQVGAAARPLFETPAF